MTCRAWSIRFMTVMTGWAAPPGGMSSGRDAHARLRERIAREEFTARTIYLPPVTAAERFHELTARRASPRRTRRGDPRGGDHAGG